MTNRHVVNPASIEILDDDMAEILRQQSEQERLCIVCTLYSSARRMLLSMLRSTHPDWTDEQIHREAARRLSYGAIQTDSLRHRRFEGLAKM